MKVVSTAGKSRLCFRCSKPMTKVLLQSDGTSQEDMAYRCDNPDCVRFGTAIVALNPIPLRNADRGLYNQIKELARTEGKTVGQLTNEGWKAVLTSRTNLKKSAKG